MAKFRCEWFLFDYKKGFPDRISRFFQNEGGCRKGLREVSGERARRNWSRNLPDSGDHT